MFCGPQLKFVVVNYLSKKVTVKKLLKPQVYNHAITPKIHLLILRRYPLFSLLQNLPQTVGIVSSTRTNQNIAQVVALEKLQKQQIMGRVSTGIPLVTRIRTWSFVTLGKFNHKLIHELAFLIKSPAWVTLQYCISQILEISTVQQREFGKINLEWGVTSKSLLHLAMISICFLQKLTKNVWCYSLLKKRRMDKIRSTFSSNI